MAKTPQGKPVKVVRQQFVRLGEARGDFVVVKAGLMAGQEVVSAGAFKLRNGSPIVVDNTVKPEPELSPRPENR
jgi:membrane fusion protein (multidrug efflux system)